MDTILHGGRIHVVDERFSTVSAIAIQSGRIAAIGSDEEVLALAGPRTRRIDLDGATVVPGLLDSHLHLVLEADTWGRADLRGVKSVAEVCDRLSQHAAGIPDGDWVLGSPFWHESPTRESRLPNREELDRACPRHPVMIPRGMNRAMVNSLALDGAGITSETPDPPGGVIGRDEHGQPTGFLLGAAQRLVKRLLPPLTHAQRREAMGDAMKRYAAVGITGVREAATTPNDARILQELWASGDMAIRVSMMPILRQPKTVEQETSPDPIIEQLRDMHMRTGYGDAWLRIGALKMLVDGALETAWMREPYDSNPESRGVLRIGADVLDGFLPVVADENWSLAMHVAGDAGMDVYLGAVKRLCESRDIRDLRWTIEHTFFCDPEQCREMKELGLIPAVHLPLAYDFGDAMVGNWGRARADRLMPVRDMIEAGLEPAGGSDGPFVTISPLLGMQMLMTRETVLAGAFGPEQAVDARTALLMYTRYNAFITFEEHVKGSLEPGKLADLVVLGRDPLSVEPAEVGTIPVLMTMVDGVVKHSAGMG